MVAQTLCWLSKAAFARLFKSSSKCCCPLCRLSAQEKEIEALKSCVSELKSSVSEIKSKFNSVMSSLSMTASSSGMDPQLIPMSLRKHEPRDQIRQQSANQVSHKIV